MVKLDKNENHCLFDKTAPESAPCRYFTSYDYACQILGIFKFPNEDFSSGGLIEDAKYRINQIKKIEKSDEVQKKCNLMLDCIGKYENDETTLGELKEQIVQILNEFENIKVGK